MRNNIMAGKAMKLQSLMFLAMSRVASAQFSVSVGTITSDCTGCDESGPVTQTGCTEVGDGVKVPCSVVLSLNQVQNSLASESAMNATQTAPITASATPTTIPAETGLPSLTRTSYPSYIRPSENTQDCDIYGPLCQTGSITVGVNGSMPTTTVVACSDYLNAQALSVFPRFGQAGQLPRAGELPSDWATSFGRSPECTSFAQADPAAGSVSIGQPTSIPGCPANQTANPFLTPPGVLLDQRNAQQYSCCGNCQVHVDKVQIAYFPTNSELSCSQTAGATQSRNAASSIITPGPVPQENSGLETFVEDGFTYTNPSLYLKIVGTAEVSDSCGIQEPVLTAPTLAIPPGGLSTISYDMSVGETFAGPEAHPATTKLLQLDDLACPTFGFSDPFNVTTTDSMGNPFTNYGVRTVGPPWNPVVVPPRELLEADKSWKCSRFESDDSPWVITYGIFDPPQKLTPAAGLETPESTVRGETTPTTSDSDPTTTVFQPSTVNGGLVDTRPTQTTPPSAEEDPASEDSTTVGSDDATSPSPEDPTSEVNPGVGSDSAASPFPEEDSSNEVDPGVGSDGTAPPPPQEDPSSEADSGSGSDDNSLENGGSANSNADVGSGEFSEDSSGGGDSGRTSGGASDNGPSLGASSDRLPSTQDSIPDPGLAPGDTTEESQDQAPASEEVGDDLESSGTPLGGVDVIPAPPVPAGSNSATATDGSTSSLQSDPSDVEDQESSDSATQARDTLGGPQSSPVDVSGSVSSIDPSDSGSGLHVDTDMQGQTVTRVSDNDVSSSFMTTTNAGGSVVSELVETDAVGKAATTTGRLSGGVATQTDSDGLTTTESIQAGSASAAGRVPGVWSACAALLLWFVILV